MTTELAYLPNNSPDGARPTRMPNAGWFKPRDKRINRAGRPKGAKAAPRKAVKPQEGKLKTLFVPVLDMRHYISGLMAPWLINLPGGCQIVDASFDSVRRGIVLTLFCEAFGFVKKGERIPEFPGNYNGLKYRQVQVSVPRR